MKRIITKAECKGSEAKKIMTPKGLRILAQNESNKPDKLKPNFNADMLIDEILFSKILFTKQLALRSIKNNKLFILENCSLYNTHKFIQVRH